MSLNLYLFLTDVCKSLQGHTPFITRNSMVVVSRENLRSQTYSWRMSVTCNLCKITKHNFQICEIKGLQN